jgi:type I restriction enzyme S subunit
LGESCTEFRSGDFIKAENISDYGAYPVFGGNGLRGYTDRYNHDGDYALIGRQGALCGNMNYSSGKAYFTEHAVAVRANSLNDTLFFFYCLGTMNLGQYSGQSAQPGLAVSNLIELQAMMPPKEEQERISAFLSSLDNLITLHQRKYDKLVNIKKSMLEKMFPQDGATVPEIRFSGFTEAWEQRKLNEVATEINRNDPESNAPIMMITANNGFIEQSERYAFNNAGESLKKYILLKKGELAYNHGASKLRPYGSCFALTTSENARIPFVYHCFDVGENDSEFISIELNGSDIENQLRRIVSSGARMDGLLNISYAEYSNVELRLPITDEQQAISAFFRNLDNLITLHQRE